MTDEEQLVGIERKDVQQLQHQLDDILRQYRRNRRVRNLLYGHYRVNIRWLQQRRRRARAAARMAIEIWGDKNDGR